MSGPSARLAPWRGLWHGGAAPHPERGQLQGAGEGGGQGAPGARHAALPHGEMTSKDNHFSSEEQKTVQRNLIFEVVVLTRQWNQILLDFTENNCECISAPTNIMYIHFRKEATKIASLLNALLKGSLCILSGSCSNIGPKQHHPFKACSKYHTQLLPKYNVCNFLISGDQKEPCEDSSGWRRQGERGHQEAGPGGGGWAQGGQVWDTGGAGDQSALEN